MRLSTILSIVFVSFSFNAIAQDNAPTEKDPSPRFTKGYYTIGDNWKKLKPANTIAFDSTANQSFSKGFTTIDTSNSKLAKKNVLINRSPKKPVFSKGYTTIGNSSKKDN